MPPKRIGDDEEFSDLLEDEDEFSGGEDTEEVQRTERLPPQPRGRPRKDSVQITNKAPQNQPGPKTAPKRFSPFYQQERSGVAFTDTGEPIIEGIPVWAAQMYADMKNELDEIKDLIGKAG